MTETETLSGVIVDVEVMRAPASLDEAVRTLTDLGALTTATEWRRAALVYMLTTPSKGGRPSENMRENPQVSELSLKAFSSLGLPGLRDRGTITKYRKRWEQAMDEAGCSEPEPGQEFLLPGPDYPWYVAPIVASAKKPKALSQDSNDTPIPLTGMDEETKDWNEGEPAPEKTESAMGQEFPEAVKSDLAMAQHNAVVKMLETAAEWRNEARRALRAGDSRTYEIYLSSLDRLQTGFTEIYSLVTGDTNG